MDGIDGVGTSRLDMTSFYDFGGDDSDGFGGDGGLAFPVSAQPAPSNSTTVDEVVVTLTPRQQICNAYGDALNNAFGNLISVQTAAQAMPSVAGGLNNLRNPGALQQARQAVNNDEEAVRTYCPPAQSQQLINQGEAAVRAAFNQNDLTSFN